MPAAAVIPAPIVYTSIVAVKTFVVEFYTPRILSQDPDNLGYSRLEGLLPGYLFCQSHVARIGDVVVSYLEKITVFIASTMCHGYNSMG